MTFFRKHDLKLLWICIFLFFISFVAKPTFLNSLKKSSEFGPILVRIQLNFFWLDGQIKMFSTSKKQANKTKKSKKLKLLFKSSIEKQKKNMKISKVPKYCKERRIEIFAMSNSFSTTRFKLAGVKLSKKCLEFYR